MPQDPLQIAIEHHRGGRVRQAEAGYRTALAENPDDPEALHWLGVLRVQAGDVDSAIRLLSRAAALRPEDPAYQHNLAQAYLRRRDYDRAVAAFDRAAAAAAPDHASSAYGAGLARLLRKAPGDVEAAVTHFDRAAAAGLDSPDLHFHRGIALLSANRTDDAIAALSNAVQRRSDDADALYHLAAAYRQKDDLAQTRHWIAVAIRMRPDYARAWHALAVLEAEAGRLDEAEALFRGAFTVKPDFAPAYHDLAALLRGRGRKKEAREVLKEAERLVTGAAASEPAPRDRPPRDPVAALQEKLTPTPEVEMSHHALASASSIFPAAKVPVESVVQLFDRYADHFDEHLRGKLGYRVPEMFGRLARRIDLGRPLDVLDLGCGTGMCGAELREISRRVVGIDLSPMMIAKSHVRGVYDRLELGDVVQTMEKLDEQFDLITAGDVLIYIGDLTPLFESACRRLRPGGRMMFSLEAGTAERYTLDRKTLRYAHSETYTRRMAAMFGLEVETFDPIEVRSGGTAPVAGYLVELRLPLG